MQDRHEHVGTEEKYPLPEGAEKNVMISLLHDLKRMRISSVVQAKICKEVEDEKSLEIHKKTIADYDRRLAILERMVEEK